MFKIGEALQQLVSIKKTTVSLSFIFLWWNYPVNLIEDQLCKSSNDKASLPQNIVKGKGSTSGLLGFVNASAKFTFPGTYNVRLTFRISNSYLIMLVSPQIDRSSEFLHVDMFSNSFLESSATNLSISESNMA